jgi:hypothetical protein
MSKQILANLGLKINVKVIFLLFLLPLQFRLPCPSSLRWFGYIRRRPADAPVLSGVIRRTGNEKRGRVRPHLTWKESVKRDLKD